MAVANKRGRSKRSAAHRHLRVIPSAEPSTHPFGHGRKSGNRKPVLPRNIPGLAGLGLPHRPASPSQSDQGQPSNGGSSWGETMRRAAEAGRAARDEDVNALLLSETLAAKWDERLEQLTITDLKQRCHDIAVLRSCSGEVAKVEDETVLYRSIASSCYVDIPVFMCTCGCQQLIRISPYHVGCVSPTAVQRTTWISRLLADQFRFLTFREGLSSTGKPAPVCTALLQCHVTQH